MGKLQEFVILYKLHGRRKTYRMCVELRVAKSVEAFGGFLGRRIGEQGNIRQKKEEEIKSSVAVGRKQTTSRQKKRIKFSAVDGR